MGLRDLLVHKWQHPESRVRIASLKALKGTNAEAILKQLAIHDPSKAVRKAAAAKLSPSSLAALIRETESESLRLELVSTHLNEDGDQVHLLQIALTDSSGYVRGAAVRKLRDDPFLFQAAVSDQAADIGLVATQKISEMSYLLRVAEESPKPAIRGEAVKRLDRSLFLDTLISFAKNDREEPVREAALKCIQWDDCPSLFVELLHSDGPARLRMAAAEQVPLPDSRDLLYKLATEEQNPAIRIIAVSKLRTETDLSLMLHIAKTDTDPAVRRAAVENIDPDWVRTQLHNLAENDDNPHVRTAAKRKFPNVSTEATEDRGEVFRTESLDLAQWQRFVARAAQRAPDPFVREAALSLVDVHLHADLLRKIAKTDKNPNIRAAAVMKLSPLHCKKTLASISENDKDARVRRAAVFRLSSLK